MILAWKYFKFFVDVYNKYSKFKNKGELKQGKLKHFYLIFLSINIVKIPRPKNNY